MLKLSRAAHLHIPLFAIEVRGKRAPAAQESARLVA